jgi:hypothetical protein
MFREVVAVDVLAIRTLDLESDPERVPAMFKFDAEAFVRLLLGLLCLTAGVAVVYYALKGAPSISAFFASKLSADGRDAGFCVVLLLAGSGSAAMGFALLPTDGNPEGRWKLGDLLWPSTLVSAGLTLIASRDGVIHRWPIAFGEYKVPARAGLIFAGLVMLLCTKQRDE